MQARISGAVNRQEVEHMSERICAQRLAPSVGEWTGGARPFGYRGPVYDEKGNLLNRSEIGVTLKEGDHVAVRADPIDAIVCAYVCLVDVPISAAVDLRTQATTLRARMEELEDMVCDGELSRAGSCGSGRR